VRAPLQNTKNHLEALLLHGTPPGAGRETPTPTGSPRRSGLGILKRRARNPGFRVALTQDAGEISIRVVPYVLPRLCNVEMESEEMGSTEEHKTDVTTTTIGFVPFLGYHHVLMILIAVAIILLCTFSPNNSPIKNAD
jgi:hypothetical protein